MQRIEEDTTVTLRRYFLAVALCLSVFGPLASPPADAAAVALCPQGGLKPGCTYEVWYNDGTRSTQTADGSGTITRPCSRIITRVVAFPCSMEQPETPPVAKLGATSLA